MRDRRTVGLALILGTLVGLSGAAADGDLAGLARRFAPVIRQDTASDEDYISAFDFDGNWAGDDNWANQDDYPLAAVVYWAGVETETHAYLTYAFFHPRDVARRLERWAGKLGRLTRIYKNDPEHENDLEGILLVVEKGAAGPRPVVAETIFHRQFKKYSIDFRYQSRGYALDGSMPFEGEHPVVEVESHGHGVTAWKGEDFPGGDGVIYRVGDRAGVPRDGDDRDVPYALVDIEGTFWARRFDIGTKGNTFGTSMLANGVKIGAKFLGRKGGDDAACAPWAWADEATALPTGTIFLDPAHLVATHFTVPAGFGRAYAANPFTRPVPAGAIALAPADLLELPQGGGLLGTE